MKWPTRFSWRSVLFAFAVAQPFASAAQSSFPDVRPGRLDPSSVSQEQSAWKGLADLGAVRAPRVPGAGAVKALGAARPDATQTLRGARSVQLYKRVSPGVVLVATEDGLGSGTLLNASGDILTNWHVVGNAKQVAVIFKPREEGQKVTKKDLRLATVMRIDEVADLALVHVDSVPPGTDPIPLGDPGAIAVGADVHAIGHPTGEVWTYTMGVISQVRQDYEWSTEDKLKHRATVIQTQTPINPGNSGGPLLSDEGALIGVNSFKAKGESLNFAVALPDVRRFLAGTDERRAAPVDRAADRKDSECEPKELYSGKRASEKAEVIGVDLDCDGEVDMELRMPFDKSKPLTASLDRNKDQRIDMIVFSESRDLRKWDFSFVDTDYDGKWDLVGFHETGDLTPTRYEPYADVAARVNRARKVSRSK
jgi:S1-C subfamily serine protease